MALEGILKCSCTGFLGNSLAANFQDATYGKGMRVHTPVRKEPLGTHWRCTICRTERTKSSSDEKPKKKK
jgi:hypothetical protein